MNKIIKFFPFMPAPKDGGKLALALVFYFFVPTIVGGIIGFILGATVILLPLAFPVGAVLGVYSLAGVVFAIMKYCDYDFSEKTSTEEPTENTEVPEEKTEE